MKCGHPGISNSCGVIREHSAVCFWVGLPFIYPSTSENVDHDALGHPRNFLLKEENTVQPVFGLGLFPCHSHVDHVALRLALLLVIHQPSCDFLERKLSPQHVCDGEKWAVICRGVVDEKSAERECVQAIIEKRRNLAVDYVTKLTSIAETDQYKTHLPPDGNISTVGAKNM